MPSQFPVIQFQLHIISIIIYNKFVSTVASFRVRSVLRELSDWCFSDPQRCPSLPFPLPPRTLPLFLPPHPPPHPHPTPTFPPSPHSLPGYFVSDDPHSINMATLDISPPFSSSLSLSQTIWSLHTAKKQIAKKTDTQKTNDDSIQRKTKAVMFGNVHRSRQLHYSKMPVQNGPVLNKVLKWTGAKQGKGIRENCVFEMLKTSNKKRTMSLRNLLGNIFEVCNSKIN